MYNRYIPNPDGSHARKPVPQQSPRTQNPMPSAPDRIPEAHASCSEPENNHPREQHPAPSPAPSHSPQPAMGFPRNLLPKEFDTGDLLVVLLLLLMAADREEEKPNALLTLALYFFM